MLDSNDLDTWYSLRSLVEIAKQREKPLVFWIGAGASRWCDYPLWSELADKVHSRFLKESRYDKNIALDLLKAKDFPAFFQYAKGLNPQAFNKVVVYSLRTKSIKPVYKRFIQQLSSISPLFIVTTNIDELLEKTLPELTLVQRTDLERCIDLMRNGQGFVCKLHGSASSAQSWVFTSDEYRELLNDGKYQSLLKHLFAEATLVFIGSGLGDEYVLKLLSETADLQNLFGSGPHFAVVTKDTVVPETIKRIQYIPEPHKDHRSPIQVIDEICSVSEPGERVFNAPLAPVIPQQLISAHLLSDIIPPNVPYNFSQDAGLSDGGRVVVGPGFTDAELPHHNSTAIHDLIVGLLCFDTIYSPIHSSLNSLHKLIGEPLLTELLRLGSLKFINWPMVDCVKFESPDVPTGEVLLLSFMGFDQDGQLDFEIRQRLTPKSGQEKNAEEFFSLIKRNTIPIPQEQQFLAVNLAKGLLLRPSIRKLLGMSGGISVNEIPEWMMYPVLRLNFVVNIGVTCQSLGIASTKLDFGLSNLALPAFAAASGKDWADSMASFVLTGDYAADLGNLAIQNPEILHAILRFRETPAGMELRKEILQQLNVRAGADLEVSVNSGLNATIPTGILNNARRRFSSLFVAQGPIIETPGLWNNDARYNDTALRLWKKRSKAIYEHHCQKLGRGLYDQCPCGSGERRESCCEKALAD